MSPRTLHDAANDALFRPFPLLRPRPRLRAVAPPALQHAAALPVAIEFTIAADAADLAAAEALVVRRQGRRLVEYTRFAIDRERALPDDLAPQLMRRALLLGHVALGATDCVIEVNPRHARYYRREFGFRECGPERTCERVGAPARLLHLDMVVPPACLAHDPRTPLH